MQGLAFLSKYRTLRGKEVSGLDEIEYNFGRAFHQLGQLSLGVPVPCSYFVGCRAINSRYEALY